MRLVLALAASLLTIGGAAADDAAKRFSGDVALLMSLQDATAAGHGNAVDLQRQLLGQINKNYAKEAGKFEPVTKNVTAVVSYVLSGGNPDFAETFSKAEGLTDADRKLLAGSAHFMHGRKAEAEKDLSGIDPLKLSGEIGGRVALIEAMSLADAEPRKLELLSIAIAAMPGTLVEESALRRSAATAAAAGLPDVFCQRASRYLRRFPNSLYAPEFAQSLAGHVVTLERANHHVNLALLDTALSNLPQGRRMMVYLHMSRTATASNLLTLAQYAAKRALRLSASGSFEELTATLHDALPDIAGPDYDRALERLRGIDAKRLQQHDRLLLRAALAVADFIRQPGTDVETSPQVPEPDALAKRAATALANADATLKTITQ